MTALNIPALDKGYQATTSILSKIEKNIICAQPMFKINGTKLSSKSIKITLFSSGKRVQWPIVVYNFVNFTGHRLVGFRKIRSRQKLLRSFRINIYSNHVVMPLWDLTTKDRPDYYKFWNISGVIVCYGIIIV